MGAVAVRVASPQVKPESQGGNLPESPQTRRRRSSRGRRTGRARAGKARCDRTGALGDAEHLARKPSGIRVVSPNQRERRRLRRMRWLERRFGFVESHIEVEEIPGKGCVFRPAPRHRRRLAASCKLLADAMAEKRIPRPPTMGLDAWFRKWLELKYGTWSGVSTGLRDGDFSHGPHPEYYDEDREIDRYLRTPPPLPLPRRSGARFQSSGIVDTRRRRRLPPALAQQERRLREGNRPR